MYKSFSMELAGRTLTVDVGRVDAQANGAAFMHYGRYRRSFHCTDPISQEKGLIFSL